MALKSSKVYSSIVQRTMLVLLVFLLMLMPVYADTVTGHVTITTAAPSVIINRPSADGWYNSNFTINASIGGTTIAATYRWENSTTNGSYISLTHQGLGIWTKTFDITSVADGNYTMRINATNELSVTAEDTADFHVDDTAPVIVSFVRTRTSTIYVGNTLTSADFNCNATDNSESFGGSVAIVITGLSTATEGTKTAVCTATDLAGNIKTATVGYTVVSAGEGGGVGGGGEINLTAETVILEQLPAGQTIRLTDFPYPLISIDMEAAQTITSSDLQVSILPSAEPIPNAQVFTYFDINSNVPEGAITFVRIIFKVDKSWLEQNGFSPDDVVLYKSNSGLWVNLQTEQTGETASDYTYSATTSGFSTFAIAATKQIPPVPEAAPITGAALAVPLSAFGGYAGLIVLVIIIAMFVILIYRGREKQMESSKKGRKR